MCKPRARWGEAVATFERLVLVETDECIEWPHVRTTDGYGQVGGAKAYVHVLACERHHGPKPTPEHEVGHLPIICHNRACMNYRHLRWVTRAENVADMKVDDSRNDHLRGRRKVASHGV